MGVNWVKRERSISSGTVGEALSIFPRMLRLHVYKVGECVTPLDIMDGVSYFSYQCLFFVYGTPEKTSIVFTVSTVLTVIFEKCIQYREIHSQVL